jgi:uncharacterized protein involved in exopolysaccharide biosynthesis
MTKQGIYTSSATIWVDKPIYLPNDPTNNPYLSPATQQANLFNELLRTHTFTLGIAQKAGIPIANGTAEDIVVDDIQKHLTVDADGSNLIRVTYTSSKPQYCEQVISQAIQEFSAQINQSRAGQAQVALQLYEKQRADYEKAMNDSRDALTRYLQAHPELSRQGAAPDPTMTELQQQYTSDRERYDGVIAKILEVKNQAEAAPQVSSAIFRVMDAPEQAQPYVITVKDLLRNSLVAVLLALVALVGLTLVGTWTDQGIYTLNDVGSLAITNADGTAPELLVGLVPFIKSLSTSRRDLEKRPRVTTTRTGRKPKVTVVQPEEGSIIRRGQPEPPMPAGEPVLDMVMPGGARD